MKGKTTAPETDIIVPELDELLEERGKRRNQMRWRDAVPGEEYTWEELYLHCYKRGARIEDISQIISDKVGFRVSHASLTKKLQDLRTRGLV